MLSLHDALPICRRRETGSLSLVQGDLTMVSCQPDDGKAVVGRSHARRGSMACRSKLHPRCRAWRKGLAISGGHTTGDTDWVSRMAYRGIGDRKSTRLNSSH